MEGYAVRWHNKGAGYLTPDGRWLDYPDRWDAMTNGRRLQGGEKEALEVAQAKFEQNREWWEANRDHWSAES